MAASGRDAVVAYLLPKQAVVGSSPIARSTNIHGFLGGTDKMIARLRPIDLTVNFEDRIYRLGETVSLSVVIKPIRNATITDCKIQLLYEEQWEEFFFVSVPRFPSSPRSGRESSFTGPPISKHVVERHREEIVHTTICFLQNTELSEEKLEMYPLQFPIGPIHAGRPIAQTIRWHFAISVSMLGYHSVWINLPIKIDLSASN